MDGWIAALNQRMLFQRRVPAVKIIPVMPDISIYPRSNEPGYALPLRTV